MFQIFLFNNILYFCKIKLKNLDGKLKYDITNCDIIHQQEHFNDELALQIEVINDALDQLREKKDEPSRPIGFKMPSE